VYVAGGVVELERWEVDGTEYPRVMDPDDEMLRTRNIISR
jgi:hypothetical protein